MELDVDTLLECLKDLQSQGKGRWRVVLPSGEGAMSVRVGPIGQVWLSSTEDGSDCRPTP